MKIVAISVLLLSVLVASSDLVSEIANVNEYIESVHSMHTANIMNAHSVIMGLDLHEHHQNLLSSLSGFQLESTSSEFEPADLASCQTAVQTMVNAVNAGCNAVFAVFNNSFTDVNAGHALMQAHCAGATACHVTLSQAILAVGQQCAPVMAQLTGGVPPDFIDRLKAAIAMTEMPCIVSNEDPNKFCFEDVIALRALNQAPGVGNTFPTQNVLAQYCTRCIFKLFAAASTFAPDYARVQFALMAANCWQYPVGGEYCVLKFKDVAEESVADRQAENGTSVAHLNRVCHPCVRIFLRRVAIIYADPIFNGQLLPAARSLFFYIHLIDAMCLARGVADYCVRAILPDVQAGLYQQILPIPGQPCYDSIVGVGQTCPACGDLILNLTTSHGCCAIALYRLAGLQKFLNDAGTADADNRDDPAFPANLMVKRFNQKCAQQAGAIVLYCTAVAIKFRVTLFNIAVAVYQASQANRDAFHALLIADVAEFLGMVAADLSVPTAGVAVQSAPWYAGFVPASWVTQDTGLTVTVEIQPDNAANGDSLSSFLSSSLNAGNIPFPNTASDVRFVADPTAQVTTATSSASSVAASLALLVLLTLLL